MENLKNLENGINPETVAKIKELWQAAMKKANEYVRQMVKAWRDLVAELVTACKAAYEKMRKAAHACDPIECWCELSQSDVPIQLARTHRA